MAFHGAVAHRQVGLAVDKLNRLPGKSGAICSVGIAAQDDAIAIWIVAGFRQIEGDNAVAIAIARCRGDLLDGKGACHRDIAHEPH